MPTVSSMEMLPLFCPVAVALSVVSSMVSSVGRAANQQVVLPVCSKSPEVERRQQRTEPAPRNSGCSLHLGQGRRPGWFHI
eukprot:gene10215-biopygen19787